MDYKEKIANSLHELLKENLSQQEIYQLLEQPKHTTHGDYAFPVFSLAKTFRKAPQKIAEELAQTIDKIPFDKVQAMGPYLNFFLKKTDVSQRTLITILTEQENYGASLVGNNKKVTIDMSSPNIAKPISMGHLRSTVIGNALANIMAKIGYQPVKINHLGDWGTQFGKLITAYYHWGNEEAIRTNPIQELLKLYVHFHEEAETNSGLEEEARGWFKKLEDGNPEAVTLWKWFRDESLKEFEHIYTLLDISFDSYNGEAFFNNKMDEVVSLLAEKHLLQEDNGAEIVNLSNYDLNPALIRKSDGATLYITRDLAAALYRKRTYDFAQSLYVVGNEQTNHFKQLKAVLNELSFDWSNDIHHVNFGLITQGGKKLSTRKGKVILLEEVLNTATELAKEQITEKNPELKNKDQVAKEVGIGAVVFHDLKNDRRNNFDFILEEVVRFEGETGPYVQYTHSRCCSILRKANFDTRIPFQDLALQDDESWEIVKALENYPKVILEAAAKYEPSIIAKHAIDLSQKFNKYYAVKKILEDDSEKEARLALVASVAILLKEDLRLLGIHAPNEM